MKLNASFFLTAVIAATCWFGSATQGFSQTLNTKCPIMTEDDIDPAEASEINGIKIELCCNKCVKLWNENPKYYAKAALELGLLPQLKGKEKELGLDEVELLPQRFCPINTSNIVTPESPSSEYKGKKVYFYSATSKRRWDRDPDAAAAKAIEAGLLPQLK